MGDAIQHDVVRWRRHPPCESRQGRGTGTLVIARLTLRRRPAVLLLAAVAGLFVLSGCESDGYSEALRRVTHRPDFQHPADRRAQQPDPPGQLPLFSIDDIDNPFNPLYAKSAVTGRSKSLRDPSIIKEQDAEALEKQLVKHFGSPAAPKVSGVGSGNGGGHPTRPDDPRRREQSLSRPLPALPRAGRRRPRAYVEVGQPAPRGTIVSGLFKFQSSTDRGARKPPRETSAAPIDDGHRGNSSMPSFSLLVDDEQIDSRSATSSTSASAARSNIRCSASHTHL